ncbi:MAG: hypothetical protein LAP13_08175 [Acidobacteriia bacterium]|nr:hypothetical protein [Terriglobia bacterium]
MRRVLALAVLAFLALSNGICAESAPQANTVWQIGKFDASSLEFSTKIDIRRPDVNPVFKVGESKPEDAWPWVHPGSLNKQGGGRAHPYTVRFNLAGPPRGVYRLTVAALLFSAQVPNLQVEVNGKKGFFYFNRKKAYYPGEGAEGSPIFGSDQLEIELPASFFHAGENTLALTAMDDPQLGESESFLTYDALRLTQDPSAKARVTSQVAVEPTVFYSEKDGRLRELTNVTVTTPEKIKRGEVTLTVGKETFRSALSAEQDFGQQRFQLAVPEYASKTPAVVELRLNGKSQRLTAQLEPKRKWTIYLVPSEHLDIGYTDYQPKVVEVQNRNIDALLKDMRTHPEMRFSLDGAWCARDYLATRNAEARAEFLQHAREGRLAIPAQYACLLTGYANLEVLLRSATYAHNLHRELGIPFEYANITDIPSYSWSYASILNSLGLKYFAAASNNDRGPILLFGRWNEKSPFWWEGPDGKKILMAYTRQYAHLWFMCGLPPRQESFRDSVPTFLQAFQSPDYKPDAVLMYGSQAENTDLVPGEAPFVKNWNSGYAYPHLKLATFPDYFHYVEDKFGSSLETVKGDGGPYWEDGLGTDAWYGAIDRSNQQRALSAEKLSTLATYLVPTLAAPRELIDRMWSDLIVFSEHTWTYWGAYTRPEHEESVRQLETKDHNVNDAREAVNSLAERSLSQLADQIHIPAPALLVFNPLSWTRSALVETDIDEHLVLREYPDMKPVPVEILKRGAGYNHIRFLAVDIPSFGYKCYQLAPDQKAAKPSNDSVEGSGNTIENSFYRVEVDPATGRVRSVFDKELNKELVDSSSSYGLNQYLHVSGGDETSTQIVYTRKTLPEAKLTINPAAQGRIVENRKTAYGRVLITETSGPHAPSIQTEIILFDGEKKIEFVNHLRKEPVMNKEAVYFAFPFAVDRPTFTYDLQNGWVDPSRDMLKGAGLEWFTIQHWIRVANSDVAIGLVPVDAPLVTLGDINRGTWPEKFDPKGSSIFSYVINNYWHTNFRRVQEGNYTFRYALTSGRELTPELLARFGRSAMTPLEVNQVISNDKFGNPERPLSPAPARFLEVTETNVVVENWKSAEDGQGTIVRLLEVGGRAAEAHLLFPQLRIEEAWLANASEENREKLPVSGNSVTIRIQPHEIVTVRLVSSRASAQTAQR